MMEYEDLLAIKLSTNRLHMAINRINRQSHGGTRLNNIWDILGYSGI